MNGRGGPCSDVALWRGQGGVQTYAEGQDKRVVKLDALDAEFVEEVLTLVLRPGLETQLEGIAPGFGGEGVERDLLGQVIDNNQRSRQ